MSKMNKLTLSAEKKTVLEIAEFHSKAMFNNFTVIITAKLTYRNK